MTVALIAMGALVSIAAVVGWVVRRDVFALIETFTWARSITTEVETWVHKTSYTRPPANARNVTSRTESYSVQVPTSRTETTYTSDRTQTRWVHGYRTEWRHRTVYTYDAPRYRPGRTLTTSGEGRKDVVWPPYHQSADERETRRGERYDVTFVTDEGKRYRKRLDHARWVALDADARYRLRVNLFRSVRRFQPL